MKKRMRAQEVEFLDETEGWQHGKIKAILISGKAGAGKTTSAHILKRLLNSYFLTVEIDSFAKSVKEVAKKKGWNGKKDDSGRKLLQDIGRIGREKDKDFWVNTLISRSLNPIPRDVVIIDDWRYPNELKTLDNNKLFETYSIRIHSPERSYLKGELAEDSSETALPEEEDNILYDFYIENDGSKIDLEASLSEVMEKVIT